MLNPEIGLAIILCAATELEHRVVRGRQIVARQRELAAKLGKAFPVAVTLLKEYEKSLALLEDGHQRREVLTDTVDKAPRGSNALLAASLPTCSEPAGTIDANGAYQERTRQVALVMQILSEGGYHCELLKETLQ